VSLRRSLCATCRTPPAEPNCSRVIKLETGNRDLTIIDGAHRVFWLKLPFRILRVHLDCRRKNLPNRWLRPGK
jgi:hypothetical protein